VDDNAFATSSVSRDRSQSSNALSPPPYRDPNETAFLGAGLKDVAVQEEAPELSNLGEARPHATNELEGPFTGHTKALFTQVLQKRYFCRYDGCEDRSWFLPSERE